MDHTHFTGSLTLPLRERLARRLNTWNPVYFGFDKISYTLVLPHARRARLATVGSGGGYLAGSALSLSAMVS
nr:hypothetical protein [Nocardia acidivorans]